MNRASLLGTGKVYSFTLRQLARSKGGIVSFIIFGLVMLLAIPVTSIVMGGRSLPAERSEISTVLIQNDTDFPLDFSGRDDYWQGTAIQMMPPAEAADYYTRGLGPAEAFAHIRGGTGDGAYVIALDTAQETEISGSALDALDALLRERLEAARLFSLNVDAAQLQTAAAAYSVTVMPAAEYGAEAGVAFSGRYALQYAYAILVMMVSMYSAGYIIRAIAEEKASRLVELLMISVRPLALLAGKILAVMTYVFVTILGLALLFLISYFVSGLFLDLAPISAMLSGMGLSAALLNLSPLTAVAVLVSLALAYLTFSILAGIAGARCATIDDVQSASTSVVLTVMAGYLIACIIPAFEGGAVLVISSLVPVVSVFCAPVQYILGNIGFGVLALSWGVQAVVIVLLMQFGARVYSGLIMHGGGRVNLKTLMTLYRAQPAEGGGAK